MECQWFVKGTEGELLLEIIGGQDLGSRHDSIPIVHLDSSLRVSRPHFPTRQGMGPLHPPATRDLLPSIPAHTGAVQEFREKIEVLPYQMVVRCCQFPVGR